MPPPQYDLQNYFGADPTTLTINLAQLWSIGDSLPSKRAHESPLRRLEVLAALRAEYGVEVLYERSRVALALLEAVHRGCLVQHLKRDADTSHYAFNGPT